MNFPARQSHWLLVFLPILLPACAMTGDRPDDSIIVQRNSPASDPANSISANNLLVTVSEQSPASPVKLPATPPAEQTGTPLSITLSTALSLTQANPLDIQIADERVRIATARLQQANALWLPNLNLGVDYFRQDGRTQDILGTVFTTSRSSVIVGGGPQSVVSTSDAMFAPLAAKQMTRAAQAEAQATRNDTTLAVATAYFNVQQARGELAGSLESLRRADDLVARTDKLAPDLTPDVEVNRAKAEAARRRQAVESAYERWLVASAELTRLLRLQPDTVVEPAEDPALAVKLIDPATTLEDLMAIGLTYRPELEAHQALVQAALVRVKQEKRRPFYPVLSARGTGSNTPGLAGGYFGGGINDQLGNFGPRFSMDLQAVWEFQNLGIGNRAAIRVREGESRQALLELQRMQERISAEIVQAHAQLDRATKRLNAAEDGVANAVATAEKNLQGLGQTKRVGEQLVLVFRPLEAVAAVVALDNAYRDYYQAIGDHNRGQFRLFRALGHPSQALAQWSDSCPGDSVRISAPPVVTNP